MPKVKNFKTTPNLPELEEQVMEWWRHNHTFEKSVKNRPESKPYVFYDGPPFATGMPHYGHLLASTTKDVIPRYWTMKGFRVERVWGWDCHGLPIENMIEKKLKIAGGKKGIEELGIDTFNQACRAEVLRLDTEWEKIIQRLGRWVDMSNNYKTMDKTFMESVWWGFKQLHDKNLVYEGKKVILYCPRCSTPLSNFEIAMDNSYQEVTEPSTTYKYKLQGEKNTYLLAWSTTPWNKLATPALAVNPNLTYVKVKQGSEFYWLAKDTVENVLTAESHEVVETATGTDLIKKTFELHYDFYAHERAQDTSPSKDSSQSGTQTGTKTGVIIADEFVTADEGTGVVTLAIYGEDDYRVMLRENIQLVGHVDEEGKLKHEVTPWAGLDILEANPLIDEDLKQRGLIYKHESHTHSVATCYRCSTRLYYAPLPAWFIDVQQIKQNLLDQNEHINWYPNHLKHGRFQKGLENAPDWNISRSRYWGTPMPVWYEKQSVTVNVPTVSTSAEKNKGKKAWSEVKRHGKMRIVGSLEELKEWAVNPKQVEALDDIHREFLDDIEVWVDDAKTVKGRRIPEVFDCWVESGSMPFASLHYPFEHKDKFEASYPAQFVSEYIAQTRAWFYTMHVMSVGVFGQPPFENVLTTGTILAEDGSKMSKSKKNYPDPMLLIDKYGVDSLRLYLMSSTVMKGENLNFSEKDVADIRRKVFVIWWNVISFFQSFADQDAAITQHPATEPEHVMDKWLLSAVNQLTAEITEYMDTYDLVRASRRLMEFVDELSTWYLRLSRDRFRLAPDATIHDKAAHAQASHVFGYALYTVAQLMAPFAPFFSDVFYQSFVDDQGSIHLTDWPETKTEFLHPDLTEKMAEAKKVVELARSQRQEQGFKLRQPLAKLTVASPVSSPHDNLLTVIADELNVKQVVWKKGASLSCQLDTALTPELEAEGQARELARTIQNLRKKAGLQAEDVVIATLPDWPEEWETWLKQKANAANLVKGDEFGVEKV